MPGMMDTVLNLGLNDESVEGLAKQTSDERFAYDSYRRFVSMYGRIVLDIPAEEFEEPFEAAKQLANTDERRRGAARPAALPRPLLQADRGGAHRQAVPAGPARPAARRDRSRVPLVGRRPRPRLPHPRAHPARPRHRGQRADDGVRQPRRQLGHRAWASRATRRPGRRAPTATSSSTPRARTWWPASATPSRCRRSSRASRRSTSS